MSDQQNYGKPKNDPMYEPRHAPVVGKPLKYPWMQQMFAPEEPEAKAQAEAREHEQHPAESKGLRYPWMRGLYPNVDADGKTIERDKAAVEQQDLEGSYQPGVAEIRNRFTGEVILATRIRRNGSLEEELTEELPRAAARLSMAELSGQDFSHRGFRDAAMNEAKVDRCNWEGADFTNAKMKNLVGAGIRGDGVVLRGVDLRGAKLSGSWRGADFSGCDMRGAHVDGDMTGAIGIGSVIKDDADIEDRNERIAKLKSARPHTAELSPEAFARIPGEAKE